MSSVLYIKVSKIDENGVDQTNTLQSLTQIVLPWGGGSSSTTTFLIENISEFTDYFLYSVNPSNSMSDTTITNNRSKIEYEFSASLEDYALGLFEPTTDYKVIDLNVIEDNLNFYSNQLPNGDGDNYFIQTYPQKTLNISVSGSCTCNFTTTAGLAFPYLRLNRWRGNSSISLGSVLFTDNTPFTFNLTSSLLPSDIQPGDKLSLEVSIGTAEPESTTYINYIAFSPTSHFRVSSSAATGPTIISIPEPYFSEDFANAFDCQPLYGNAIENQTNYKYQQIDYSSDINNPINFNLIINNTALRAQVQNSNYSSLRHITPRYLGCKNQSSIINKWVESNSNIGTYGKTPSVSSTKNQIAYASLVSGWPPERSNTSTIKVNNLIDEEGNLTSPGTSGNFIHNLRNAFQSGEEILITPITEDSNGGDFTRRVLQAGKRIEPYFYNQIQFPERDGISSFTSSLNFEELNPSGINITENFSAIIGINGNIPITPGVWNNIQKTTNITTGDNITTEINSTDVQYVITSDLLASNIQSLTFTHDIRVKNYNFFSSGTFYAQLVRQRALMVGWETTQLAYAPAGTNFTTFGDGLLNPNQTRDLKFSHTINLTDLLEGDIIKVRHSSGQPTTKPLTDGSSIFSITQNPSPSGLLTVTGSGDKLFLPLVGNFDGGDGYIFQEGKTIQISSTNDTGSFFLNNIYRNPNVRQTDIASSGYNQITLPIDFKIGDEVRFDGTTTRMVEKVQFLTGSFASSILIGLDLNISGSNINHFSFIRYVDDPTSILIEGFRPINTQSDSGPYLIRPDYITTKLEENVDGYINEYVNKGLI